MQPLISPKAPSSPFALGQSKRERNLNLSASKPPRKAQGTSRLERSVSSISSPAYTPSRLRPNHDAIRTPVTHSIRKHRGLKAAEERALATELQHSALSTASDNVQVSQLVSWHIRAPAAARHVARDLNLVAAVGHCAHQAGQRERDFSWYVPHVKLLPDYLNGSCDTRLSSHKHCIHVQAADACRLL